jgi:hypothetical protein
MNYKCLKSDLLITKCFKSDMLIPWLYDSVVHQGYLCKFCELFCGHSSSSQECFTVGINLGTLWLLFYYWTSALNPTCLLQSALNPTCLLQVNDCPTHLYMWSGPLYLGKLARKWCELGKDGKSNTQPIQILYYLTQLQMTSNNM